MKKLLPLLALCLLCTGCAKETPLPESALPTEESTIAPTTQKPSSPKRDIAIRSSQDVEALSDEDLLYLYEQGSGSFCTDVKTPDDFGVPLTVIEHSDYYDYDRYEQVHFQWLTLEEMPDLETPLRSAQVHEAADAFAAALTKNDEPQISTKAPTEHREAGTSYVEDAEIIECGENADYLAYSIRCTHVKVLYENDVLTEHRIPDADRYLFWKAMVQVQTADGVQNVILGELTAQRVQDLLDQQCFASDVLWREVTETQEGFDYTLWGLYCVGGDYGINDELVLYRARRHVDKQTHVLTVEEESTRLRSIEIEGTADRGDREE